MNRGVKLVLHNWWLKVLAVGMAWFLWSVVTQGPPVETGMWVSFGVRHLSANMQIEGELPTPVYIQLRGPERLVEGLRPEQVGVTVDLKDASLGDMVLALTSEHVRVPPGVTVVSFIPEQLRLRLVAKKTPTKKKTPRR